MSIKACKTAVCASALMAVVAWSGGAFAGISQNFETDATGVTVGTAGTVVTATTTEPACGYPISGAHTKVLAITGTVTYTESATPSSNASQVDLMFKAEPTDELDDLADQTDVKVALAVVTNGVSDSTVSVQLWCKAKNAASASWVKLCDVDNASWARATLVLDYELERCRVSINGDPQVTGSAVEDSWYTFANGKGSDSYLKSITMAGSTEVDDFVVTHDANYAEPFANTPVSGATSGITYNDLNKYGITVAEATSGDGNPVLNADSGMTVSQKLAAGLNPKSATKFEMQTMTSSSATSATVTFPGNKGSAAYEVTITDKNGDAVSGASASISSDTSGEGQNTATLTLPADADLVYINLKTK